jgi:cellulose synthase/poly-beta-1,6-N-acetylglucosamine synthase-like glycosyltransferase
MLEVLFWGSVAFVLYVYAGYPLLLGVWAAFRRRVRQTPPQARGLRIRGGRDAQWPGVSIIIAARNEAGRLPQRIDNLLASDYPVSRLQIIVASDGSSDGTAAALAPYLDRIELLMLPPSGKASALNAAVERARHPILVFADARQRFASDAVSRLVRHFRNPQIGAVSGELMLDGSGSTIGDGVGAYWNYEKWLRRREAIVGSTLGVTGAIYAMRRSLWQPLPPETLLDDVLGPIRVVLQGYQVTFDSDAHAFDEAPKDAEQELRRKMRTLAGNFQLLVQEPRLLVPGVNPVWLQFMSHKIGRLFVPYALVVIFVTSAGLVTTSWLYALAFAAQLVFFALAVYGAALDRRERLALGASRVKREAA